MEILPEWTSTLCWVLCSLNALLFGAFISRVEGMPWAIVWLWFLEGSLSFPRKSYSFNIRLMCVLSVQVSFPRLTSSERANEV